MGPPVFYVLVCFLALGLIELSIPIGVKVIDDMRRITMPLLVTMELASKFMSLLLSQQINESSEVSSCELPAFGDQRGLSRHEFVEHLVVDCVGRQRLANRLANLMQLFGEDANFFAEVLSEFAKSLGLSVVQLKLIGDAGSVK